MPRKLQTMKLVDKTEQDGFAFNEVEKARFSRWWFQIFCIYTPTWGFHDPI